MATFVLTDAEVTIGGVDLSNDIRSITIDATAEEADDSAMGDSWRSRIGGVKDWSVSIEFNQDYDASQVDATLWPLLGTTAAITGKPTSAATSATNPVYSGNALVTQYSPLSNGFGDLATVSVTWPGSGALARATS